MKLHLWALLVILGPINGAAFILGGIAYLIVITILGCGYVIMLGCGYVIMLTLEVFERLNHNQPRKAHQR